MSFGYSVGDAVLLGQLAWRTIQNSRKACGEHDELTRDASSLHMVIRRLEKEACKPESPINRPNDKCHEELQGLVDGCEKVLEVLNKVLEKYNTLSEKERGANRLWQKVRFGNGELADMRYLRERITYYTSALSLFVNMVSMSSIGRVEQQMEVAGGDIREIQIAVNGITAYLLSASNREGSVLTTYADDDKAVWKEFRKELIEEGFSSSIIRKHKRLIKAYIKELGDRELLDDEDPHNIEDLSELAATGTDDYAAPSGLSNMLAKTPSMAASNIESSIPKDDQVSIKENSVEPPPNEASNTACSSNTVPTPEPSNAFAMNELDTFFHESLNNPATFKIIILPAYERTKTITDDKNNLAELSGECLTVGEIGNTCQLLKERFKARLQILSECLPHFWVFQARGDIDEVHIYVANSCGIGMDYKVAELFAESASEIILKFTGFPVFAVAGILGEGLNAFLPQGSLSQRAPWIKLEELTSLEWELDETESVLETCFLIGKWIRRFDTEFGAIAKRLASTWAKAAELITNSSFNGMRSLAIICERKEVSSESRPQSQEEISPSGSPQPNVHYTYWIPPQYQSPTTSPKSTKRHSREQSYTYPPASEGWHSPPGYPSQGYYTARPDYQSPPMHQDYVSRDNSEWSEPRARRISKSSTNGLKRYASTRSQKQPIINDTSDEADEPEFTYIRPQASRFKEAKYFKPPKANPYFFFNQELAREKTSNRNNSERLRDTVSRQWQKVDKRQRTRSIGLIGCQQW